MQIRIKLNNPPIEDEVSVGLKWNVEVTKPKSGSLPKLFRRHNQVSRDLEVSIVDIKIADDIVCDKKKLFSIYYDDTRYDQSDFPVAIDLDQMTKSFQIVFHQKQIIDCRKPQDANPRTLRIYFRAVLTDMKGNDVDSVKDFIDIIFEPLGIKPFYNIDIDNENVQYSALLGWEKLGEFKASIKEKLDFVPTQLASVKLNLYKGNQLLANHIKFGGEFDNSLVDLKLQSSSVLELPIFVNFTDIANPITDEEDFTIETVIEQSAIYSPEICETIVRQTHFSLLKDQQGTEMIVEVKGPGCEEWKRAENSLTQPTMQMTFVPRSRLTGRASVKFLNIATDDSNRRAGLYINNLTISEQLIGENIKVIGIDGSAIRRFITLDGRDVESMQGDGLFIPNGQDSKSIVNITFSPEGIIDLVGSPTYDFQLRTELSFDYWEDKDGLGQLTEDMRHTMSIPLMWNLHLEPNPEWLCVDYGSSAIVCNYDNQVVDLRRQKVSIFRDYADGRFSNDDIENGTPFLSSDILFHSVPNAEESTLCSQQKAGEDGRYPAYENLSVCLSPTSNLIKNNVRTQLPCLKILMGNEFLPKKPDFETFRYMRLDSSGALGLIEAKNAMSNKEETCLLRISSIFNESYEALMRYFILPQTKDKSINKLVLTYPNTYTPTHLHQLEKIVKRTFPKVRQGYMRFVSESDAVAAYYLDNWDLFNPNGDINEEETILVYDMGAGTLDLTLLRKAREKQGKIVVDILGKIGTGKAGNYLDYLLCEMLNDKYSTKFAQKPLSVSTASTPDVATLEERIRLKELVKNKVKPNLKLDQVIHIGGLTFNSDEILDDERFDTFIRDITDGIIKQLLNHIGMNRLHIDTILMSGRGCRLEPLAEALGEALSEVGSPNARVVKIPSTDNKEKTAVAEGAMAMVARLSSAESPIMIRSHRLYASYGLIYRRLGGSYSYAELLNSTNMPYAVDWEHHEDFEGPNVVVEGTAAAGTIKLVQTYLSPEETEEAYSKGDLEFISEMEEYDMANLGGRNRLNVKLKLDYRNNIALYVNGLESVGSSPKGIDLTSEITKRSVWPVTI